MNVLDKIKAKEPNENSGDTVAFGEFEIICKKCGSKKVHINYQEGFFYSEYTNATSTLSLKCKKCGYFHEVIE